MGNRPSIGHSSRVLVVWAEKRKLKRYRHYISKLPLVGLEMKSIGVWAFTLNVRASTEQWPILKATVQPWAGCARFVCWMANFICKIELCLGLSKLWQQ
jgi:hypothetical protein